MSHVVETVSLKIRIWFDPFRKIWRRGKRAILLIVDKQKNETFISAEHRKQRETRNWLKTSEISSLWARTKSKYFLAVRYRIDNLQSG